MSGNTSNNNHSVPYAQPYSWDSPSMEAVQQSSIRSLRRKRKFLGTGAAWLQKELSTTTTTSSSNSSSRPTSNLGRTAHNILTNLLQQHGIIESTVIDNNNNSSNSGAGCGGEEDSEDGMALWQPHVPSKKRKVIHFQKRGEPKPNTTDEEILDNAQQGEYSLFKSLLRVVETEDGDLHTKVFLTKASLLVQPSSIPGSMDAKDMILASLHFLSSKYVPESDKIPELPLIREVQLYSDLEKRSYRKSGNWKLEDIEEKLLKLEELFLTSASSWKWLRREVFCPRLTEEEEALYFRKGTAPQKSDPKKKGVTRRGGPRKSTPSSPAPSTIRSETPTQSVLAEASVDGTATSVDDDDEEEDGPVVEATILDDDE